MIGAALSMCLLCDVLGDRGERVGPPVALVLQRRQPRTRLPAESVRLPLGLKEDQRPLSAHDS